MSRKKKRSRVKKFFKKTPLYWFVHIVQYAVFRILEFFFSSLSGNPLERLGRAAGIFFFHYYPRQRKVCIANLQQVYGRRLGSVGVLKMAKSVYRHWGIVMGEMFWVTRNLSRENWRRHVKLEGRENLDNALSKGNGVILIAAHLGNWELLGFITALLGYQLYSVARMIENPYIHRYVLNMRTRCGQKILDKEGALKGMVQALKNNGVVGILADQNAGSSGVFVDFFGRKASTTRSPAALALKYETPIVPLYCYRLGCGPSYVLGYEPALVPSVTEYSEDAIPEVTQQVTTKLEEMILRKPEQWVWLHNRWRTRPPEESPLPPAKPQRSPDEVGGEG
ncbi:MAG: lysophospholipid acyltransferase family protein [Planctomycetota bacterium]|nr:lysophospholipid acyltransferase family protein [Planctomycetota bacterium]